MMRAMALVLLLVGAVSAQEKVAPKDAQAAPAPLIADEAKRQAAELQIKAAGLTAAQAVLQRELDAVNADFARLVQRLQAQCAAAPGYELSSALTCALKKADAKKDPPK